MIYIVVKGEAQNHRNKTDELDNLCNVVGDYETALEDAKEFILNGSIKVQIFQLETELIVEDITQIRNGLKEQIKLKE